MVLDPMSPNLYPYDMSGLEKVRLNRASILSVAAKHGAERLRIFGSAVHNEDKPGSDIDFLVSMSAGRDLFDLVAFKRDLDELLQQSADVVTDEELSPYIRGRILKEAVAI